MPLTHDPQARRRNVAKLVREGYPPDQAVAIASRTEGPLPPVKKPKPRPPREG